ncbi:hypothetical protein TraAM80_05337 [Trypanosoma rangeli]|uniref:Cyclic nucleotide-binding domain-containing protein n=1 Tax=Trypanosoma rangeli TaxID=5698 RepID=A0A3S5IR31_TRYRA|nr:uncharacterized protein TraAM80_05337 [Trypanosoma rangeli]RNF04060.1 hypothetical protein TraAM80_05337 [Trypanosoma rangeli]|eukprot:RNF04060.1 hypothetical protein TraAM80_05337 [Trypanosoma rangeli]
MGASFGELSVLFGEPRQFILRAQTTCDVWCLSCQSFTSTVRRDDALRRNLLSKAAALRMRWLGEQRYTASLAQVLRESCELFREAPDSFIRLVQERMEPVVYPPATLLTSISSRCGEMFLILHGRVTSIVDGVAEYGPGSVIGEPTIIDHRWPLGLVSKSMVEGWKLSRPHLRDALHRIEILRRHSGEVGSHIQQLMQKVFASPHPPCDVDIVGRPRMPLVGPPPRGRTYMEFAMWLAEVQLKAICFRFRDYIKWDDISYSASPVEAPSRASITSSASARCTSIPDAGSFSFQSMAGSGVHAARRGKKNVSTRPRKANRLVVGSNFPFYVNLAIVHQPFTQPLLRKPLSVFRKEKEQEEEETFFVRQRAITASPNARVRVSMMPQLEQLKTLFEGRDKLHKVETRQHEPVEMQQDRLDPVKVTRFGCPPPVHIFLQGSRPRVQITVEEAISVGYVLQFPDAKNIQACVSHIDSDVTIGLPQHRQRRREMALTPNIRHHRRCFLFAASQLDENGKEEALVKAVAVKDAEDNEKAQHLATLLMSKMPEAEPRLNVLQAAGAREDSGLPSDWQRSFLFCSLSGTASPSKQTLSGRQALSPSKEQDESVFLRQLRNNPEKAMRSLRSRLSLPLENSESEAPGNEGSHQFPDNLPNLSSKTQGNDLLDRLRRASDVHEVKLPENSFTGVPPRPPSSLPNENEPDKVGEEGEGQLDSFMGGESAPLFVDGYGQLGSSASHPMAETQAHQELPVGVVPPELNRRKSSIGPYESKRDDVSARAPCNFVMPTVREAIVTMRRMQRDVEGLNAVAEEQKRERLQRSRCRVDGKPAFVTDASLLAEYKRMADDWAITYKDKARDPLYTSTIPPLLLAEAGTDYLAEEYQVIRHQQTTESNTTHGVEEWRGELEAKDRHSRKDDSEVRKKVSTHVMTFVGPRKLGLHSKPLESPLSHLTQEEYQQWLEERDAVFRAARRLP